jgi:hypothetical protein
MAWSPRLLVLALAAQLSLPAPAEAASAVAPARRGHAVAREKHSGLDARVATLTRALSLDPKQQAGVRRALLDQSEQVKRIWRDGSASAADRITATRSVSMHTADRIRALLNEDQRKRYDPPAQADPGQAIRNTNVEEWMKRQKK